MVGAAWAGVAARSPPSVATAAAAPAFHKRCFTSPPRWLIGALRVAARFGSALDRRGPIGEDRRVGGELAVTLFGAVRLWQGEREVPVRPGQQRALVALLALAAGRPVGRAQIEEALWGTDRPPGAWNVVQTHVKRLRAALEPARPQRADSVLLPRAGTGYQLSLHSDRIDLHRFMSLTQHARAAQRDGQPRRAFAGFEEAFAQWRGDPVGDVPLLAEHPTVSAAVRRRWTAAGWYADVALALGRAADVLALVEESAWANPLDEQTHATLICVYQAVRRREAAVTTFHDTRRPLVHHLGVDPR